MFWTKDPESPKYFQSLLEKELEIAITSLKGSQPSSAEYAKAVANIAILHEMTTKEQPKSQSVSKDTLVTAGANLIGILMIIRHEHLNVIATKALSLVTRVR